MSNIKAPALSYRLLSLALFFVWLLHAVIQSVKHKDISYLLQRLGISKNKILPNAIWVHAASVGEVELVKPLISVLSESHSIVLTTFTPTGNQHAKRIMPPEVQVTALPIDFMPICLFFILRNQFKLGLVAETELWPETLYSFKKLNMPLIQINARLSDKTLNNPYWLKQILSRTLGYFDAHLTRSEADVVTLKSMGVYASRIKICGNLKYANFEDIENQDNTNLIDRPYLLFASTHDIEEKIFADVVQSLASDETISDPAKRLMVIAPRHPHRASDIKISLQSLGLNLSQRSKGEVISDQTQIYLADTLGELKPLMAHARLVIMGGSFTNVGGHNILEAAQLGKAVITGPSDDNIKQDISLLKQHDAIIQVDSQSELQLQLKELLTHPERINELAANARIVISKQQHVLKNYLSTINTSL